MFPQTILLGLVAAVPTPDDYQAYTPAAVDEKPVFAHYMLCFAAFGEKGEHKTTACDNIYLARYLLAPPYLIYN